MMENELKTYTGIVADVIYENEDNGYKIIEVETKDEDFVAVGYLSGINPGDSVKLTGSWVTHRIYGEQLKVEMYEKRLPTGRDAIYRYLSSGIIKGIRESTAKKIVEQFGEKSLEIIENEPGQLAKISGISLKKAQQMHDCYMEQIGATQLVMFLQNYSVTSKMSAKIYKKFGSAAVELIQSNPYILCDEIDGIGFKTADSLAMQMNVEKINPMRIKSGVLYTLKFNTSFGHTYLPEDVLIKQASSLLEVTEDLVNQSVDALIFYGTLVCENFDDAKRVYYYPYYMCEKNVAERLRALNQITYKYSDGELEKQIDIIEKTEGMKFAELQRSAVKSAMKNSVLVITGGPGTGKTTIINAIISIMKSNGLDVTLTAPTGRAAKRMSQVCRLEAKTIHRLLGASFKGEDEMDFQSDESSPIETDVVIVDEVSMVDVVLMNSLLSALKNGTRLVLVGDVNQLPSVGPGNVLADIIDSNKISVIRLTEIFRQAQESMIVTNAHKVNEGSYPVCNQKDKDFYFKNFDSPEAGYKYILELCSTRLPKAYGIESYDIQVLSPAKKGMCGVYNLNKGLQEVLNPPGKNKKEKEYGDTIFREGDKVMQIRNNYDLKWESTHDFTVGEGVFNGDVGTILKISDTFKTVTVLYDDKKVVYEYSNLDEIELAYCVTVHKSQGSEFGAVIMPMYEAPYMLLNRNLFYTGITRAKDLVVLVGRADIMAKMVDNNREDRRFSGLKEKLCTDDEIIRF